MEADKKTDREKIIEQIPEMASVFSRLDELENEVIVLKSELEDKASNWEINDIVTEELQYMTDDLKSEVEAVSVEFQGKVDELKDEIVELHLLGPDKED